MSEFRKCAGCDEPTRSPRTKWCSERCRRNTLYGGVCSQCGARTNGSDGPGRAPTLCRKHARQARDLKRRALIERLWREGLTTKQICDRVGVRYFTSTVAGWRALGWDLPHRRTPEQLARTLPAATERMAKARAARGKAAA